MAGSGGESKESRSSLMGGADPTFRTGLEAERMPPPSVRGMSRWHDVVDWIGGYPFEVASPEAVVDFCRARGFSLLRLKTCGRKMGCNEFVFERGRSGPSHRWPA